MRSALCRVTGVPFIAQVSRTATGSYLHGAATHRVAAEPIRGCADFEPGITILLKGSSVCVFIETVFSVPNFPTKVYHGMHTAGLKSSVRGMKDACTVL